MANKVYVETILALTEAFLGYCEKASNKDLMDFLNNAGNGNFTRFGKELDEVGYFDYGEKNGHEWCTQFVAWVFWMASGKDIEKTKKVLCVPLNEKNKSAGCEGIRDYFRAAGRYDAKPRIGDLVLFTTKNNGKNDADHVGILTDISVDGLRIYTREGNKDNKVSSCVYPIDYWKILGYCHPIYDISENQSEEIKELEAANQNLLKKIDQLKNTLKQIAELAA